MAYNIQTLRVQKGWSQERLANECELDRTYVSAVERCRWNVSLSNIEKSATALSCLAWQLLKYPRATAYVVHFSTYTPSNSSSRNSSDQ
ncbi:helix-turn-helix transcriptional regulator, partial [Glaesserella parasuis]|nr:helix-turn-helix transcriptional regulator [Glaesserella parasuis]MDP0320764.1 helix-turn-helix transcriptional regulator [Glaesserella parasuis]